MKKLKVKLNSRITRIYIGRNLNDFIVKILFKVQGKNLFVVSKSIYPSVKDLISATSLIEPIIIDSKEENKGLQSFEKLLKQCYDRSLSRKDRIIGIGGGMIGDYIGFLTATYMRGIEFVYVPTTLMSQCDAVLNKVALNVNGIKNLIGSFYSPSLVLCDVNFIDSLPESAINYGMTEIVKHAVVKSSRLLKMLKNYSGKNMQREEYNWEQLVYESLKVKISLIKKDFFDDKGIQRGLNYGHTFAHALEDYTKYSYSHGYAVAIGLKLAGLVSKELKLLNSRNLDIQNQLLKLTNLDLSLPADFNTDKFISLLKRHRHSEDKISLILLEKLGKYAMYNQIDEELVRRVINRHKRSS